MKHSGNRRTPCNSTARSKQNIYAASKLVPFDLLEIDFFLGGIEVCHNAYTTQRRKEIYGPDADFFRPERWLEAAAEADQLNDEGEGGEVGDTEERPAMIPTKSSQSRLARMESTLELIFGSGRFGCLGRHIALIELDKVIPTLLRDFDWSVVEPQKGFQSQCFGVFIQRGLWLRATHRGERKV